MMKKTAYCLTAIIIAGGALAAASAMATENSITFQGQIKDTSCVLDTSSVPVAMPDIVVSELNHDGAKGQAQQVDIKFTSCPVSKNSVVVDLSANDYTMNSNGINIPNKATENAAQNVAIEFDTKNLWTTGLMSQINKTTGEAHIKGTVAYVATGGSAIAGNFYNAMTYTLTYI